MLRSPGGKYKARKLIHSLAPLAYREFRESFLGGCNLIWDIPDDKAIWINDANPLIIRYFEAIRDDPDFIDSMMQLKKRLITNEQKRTEFMAAKARLALTFDPLSFWLVNRYAAQAIVSLNRKDIASFASVFIRDGLDTVTRAKMERLRSILRRPNCTITCGDYAPLLEAPGDGVWLVLDPPYLMDHRNSPIYEYYMDEAEHVTLSRRLKSCEHKWLMTIGDCRISRDLYRGFRMRHRRYTGSMPHRTPDRNRTELIVMNY